MATCGSLDTFFCFTLPSAVFTRIDFPSKSIHVGVICGEPSFIRVATNAKFFPVKSCITESSISRLICMFSSCYQIIKVIRFVIRQKSGPDGFWYFQIDYKVLLVRFLSNKLYTNADNPAPTINTPIGTDPKCVASIAGTPEKYTINATDIPKTTNSLFFIHFSGSV